MDAAARPAVAQAAGIQVAGAPAAVAGPFADFYGLHYRSVVSLVYTLSGSRAAAEELAQDAFIRAHDRWETVRTHPDPEAWVKRVAINLARSWARRKLIEAKALARLTREPIRVAEMDEPAERLWQHVRLLVGDDQAVELTSSGVSMAELLSAASSLEPVG